MSDKRTLARLDAARWTAAVRQVRYLRLSGRLTEPQLAVGLSVLNRYGMTPWTSNPLWYVRDCLRTDVSAFTWGKFASWGDLR